MSTPDNNGNGEGDAEIDEDTIIISLPTWLLNLDIALFSIITAFCLGSIVFVCFYRKKPIIALGQPFFLVQLCIGGLLLDLFLILFRVPYLINEGGSFYCNLGKSLGWVGVVFILTVLFSRTYRIYKVTQMKRHSVVNVKQIIIPYIASVIVLVVILVTWVIIAPWEFVRNIQISDTNAYLSSCVFGESGIYFHYGISIFCLMVNTGVFIFAWRMRGINEEIAETHRILGLIIFTFIIVFCFTGIDTFFYFHTDGFVISGLDSYGTWLCLEIVYTFLTAATAFVPVSVLIMPRMYYIWFQKHHDGHLPEQVELQIPGTGRSHIAPKSFINHNNNENNKGKPLEVLPAINSACYELETPQNLPPCTSDRNDESC